MQIQANGIIRGTITIMFLLFAQIKWQQSGEDGKDAIQYLKFIRHLTRPRVVTLLERKRGKNHPVTTLPPKSHQMCRP